MPRPRKTDAHTPHVDWVYIQGGDTFRRVVAVTDEQVTYRTSRGQTRTTPRDRWEVWASRARRCVPYEIPPKLRD
jgi:hypothetical protein